jgi:DNA anti-recombination protein RmuC
VASAPSIKKCGTIKKGAREVATIEELEKRVRYVESEVEGEKLITRRVYDQAVRNGDQLAALRSEIATAKVDIQATGPRVDHIAQEVVQNTAALRNHGTLLTMLQQDVGTIRSDVTALRRGQEELHVRLDRMQEETSARLDRIQEETSARLDRMQEETSARLDRMQEETSARLDRMESNIAAILAAVTPRT